MAADLLEWAGKAQPEARCERRPGPLRSLCRRDRMADAIPTSKTCGGCERDLPLTEFVLRNKAKGYRASRCKDCKRTYRAAYYQANAEQQKAYSRQHRQENPASEVQRERMRAGTEAYRGRMRARTPEEAAAAMPDEKRCSWCHEVKPSSAFARNRNTRTGLQDRCYDCHRDGRYGLEPGEYDRRMKEQGGRCAICRGPNPHGFELSVDHDHRCCPGHKSCGKCIRGLLCQNCNVALGMFGDDPLLLEKAIAYLKGVVHHRV